MKPHVRRGVAFVVRKAISGATSSSIYDYSESSHFHFSGTVSASSVSVYDHAEGCHVSGNLPNLFHHGDGRHIQLVIGNGQHFTGFDYGTGSHFSGRVSGRSVSLYDYEHGQHFNYSL